MTNNEKYERDIRFLKINQLRDYYAEKGLTIVGLNDSQGVNTTTLFRKGLLEYLAELLIDEKKNAQVINAFSLMFNKTEHIDYFLESNLSVEDIKDLQVNGMVSALEKAMKDFHFPKFLGKVGYVSRVLYRKKDRDSEMYLTDSIREATEPIIIYSCGANDLMREGWNNPFKISKDYKNRYKNGNYQYTLTKFKDPNTVKKVIVNVERNINNILNLNDKADIYTLGIYVPKSMQSEGMEIFNAAIEEYNQQLIELGEQYGLQYIDTEANGKQYNNNKINFHVSTSGHWALAELITEEIYYRKFGFKDNLSKPISSNLKIQNNGLYDIHVNLKHDLARLEKECIGISGREAEVYEAKINELERQKEVVEKVLIKRM